MHDGCPTACGEDAAFGYVNIFKAHVNVSLSQHSDAGFCRAAGRKRQTGPDPGATHLKQSLDWLEHRDLPRERLRKMLAAQLGAAIEAAGT